MTTQSSPIITEMKVIPVAGHDSTVAGIDGGDGQPRDGGERLARLHAVRLHDVRIVLARLDERLGQVALGVQPLVRSVL